MLDSFRNLCLAGCALLLGFPVGGVLPGRTQDWIPVRCERSEQVFSVKAEATLHDVVLQIRPPKGWKGDRHGLHLWIADARVVALRASQLSTFRAELKALEAQISDPEINQGDCKDRLKSIQRKALAALPELQDYDPFLQFQLLADGKGAPTPAVPLLPAERKEGAYFVRIPIHPGMDIMAGTPLEALSIGLDEVSLDHSGSRPVRHPVQVPLPEPWNSPFNASRPLEQELFGGRGVILRWSGAKQARLARCLLVSEPDCSGAYPMFTFRGAWTELTETLRTTLNPPLVDDPALKEDTSVLRIVPALGYEIAYFDMTLALKTPKGNLVLESLSNPGPTGFKFHHFARVRNGCVLVYETEELEKPSNPNGYCGAGTECSLTWIHVGADLQIIKQEAVTLASCLDNIEGDGGWVEERHRFEWGVTQHRNRQTVETDITFDPTRPLQGLKVHVSREQDPEAP